MSDELKCRVADAQDFPRIIGMVRDFYAEDRITYQPALVEPGLQEKPLSIAMREIHEDLLEHTEGE